MRLLADLNISPKNVSRLRAAGHDVIRVTDRLPQSARDREIVALAIAESRAIVTHDIDFTSLVALSGLDRPSVVSLRLTRVSLEATDRALQQALTNHQSELLGERW